MSNLNDGSGPAFPQQLSDGQRERGCSADFGLGGLTERQWAAIQLRVPESGCDWLDDIILQAKLNEFAGIVLPHLAASDVLITPQAVAKAAYQLAVAMTEEMGRRA